MRKNTISIISLIVLLLTAGSLKAQPLERALWQLPLEERLKQHVYALSQDSMMGRAAGSEYGHKAAKYVSEQFEEIGIEPYLEEGYYQRFNVSPNQLQKMSSALFQTESKNDLKCMNVIGLITGSHPILRNEYIVVGAHFDHLGTKGKEDEMEIYSGADDNASGVGALIELGRLLKERQGELNRSIILIAFDAEELGLHGSRYFVDEETAPLDRIKLMINFDMVGWLKESEMLTYYASGTLEEDLDIFDPYEIPAGLTVDVKEFKKHPFGGLDAEPFAEEGIPVMQVTTGTTSPYHKPEDTAEKIDYDGLALITQHVEHLSLRAATLDKIEGEGAKQQVRRKQSLLPVFKFGATLSLGANSHHYTKGPINGKNRGFYSAGLYTDIRLSRNGVFVLRPEVAYERVGAKNPDGNIWTNGIAVPLNLVIATPPIIPIGFQIMLGGYYTHRYSGNQGPHRIDFTNKYYRNELGLSWGISMKLKPVTLGVRVRYGMTDFTREREASGAHIKNRSTVFMLGYEF